MARWPILFLALSSLLLSSCAYHKFASSTRSAEHAPPLAPVIPPIGQSVKYKANIDILKNHFTGLIVIKQTDSVTTHLVFVTELGMRMFDFEIKGDTMKPVFVFPALNKPKLVEALLRNFSSMLLIEWKNNKVEQRMKKFKIVLYLKREKRNLFAEVSPSVHNVKVNELAVFNKRKKESKTIYTDDYSSIKLKQYGLVKLYIELEKVKE
jgi:hypothetical protein